MYCSKCGNQCTEKDLFCRKCGYEFENQTESKLIKVWNKKVFLSLIISSILIILIHMSLFFNQQKDDFSAKNINAAEVYIETFSMLNQAISLTYILDEKYYYNLGDLKKAFKERLEIVNEYNDGFSLLNGARIIFKPLNTSCDLLSNSVPDENTACAEIIIDVNGNKKPNKLSKYIDDLQDRFSLLLYPNDIVYRQESLEEELLKSNSDFAINHGFIFPTHKEKASKCDDYNIKKLVTEAFRENDLFFTQIDINSISNIIVKYPVPTDYNNVIDKYYCSATIVANSNSGGFRPTNYNFNNIYYSTASDGTYLSQFTQYECSVNYTSQLSEGHDLITLSKCLDETLFGRMGWGNFYCEGDCKKIKLKENQRQKNRYEQPKSNTPAPSLAPTGGSGTKLKAKPAPPTARPSLKPPATPKPSNEQLKQQAENELFNGTSSKNLMKEAENELF